MRAGSAVRGSLNQSACPSPNEAARAMTCHTSATATTDETYGATNAALSSRPTQRSRKGGKGGAAPREDLPHDPHRHDRRDIRSDERGAEQPSDPAVAIAMHGERAAEHRYR